jgi:AHBA synthesis associated protein
MPPKVRSQAALSVGRITRAGIPATAAMMIGDAVTDLRSAQAAGVAAVAAIWGEGDEEQLRAAEPDFVLRQPAEVPMLIRSHLLRGTA